MKMDSFPSLAKRAIKEIPFAKQKRRSFRLGTADDNNWKNIAEWPQPPSAEQLEAQFQASLYPETQAQFSIPVFRRSKSRPCAVGRALSADRFFD